MKDLYYTIEENGYHIYDKNDTFFHIHQYEPYIPDKSKSYEENAQAQIHEIMVGEYASEVTAGTIAMDDVPEGYKVEVQAIIDIQELTVDQVLAEIETEVGING